MKSIEFLQNKFEKRIKIGTLLYERFSIERFIGKGSYGQAYEAYDRHLEKKVVVKQLRRRKLMTTEGLRSFIREATILKELNHPAIPKLISNFQLDNQRYIVMEHIGGQNFEELIFHEGKIYNEQQSFSILNTILNVVQYIHSQRIVHRDLRIPNIMTRNDQLYIIDFGLARSVEDIEQPKTDLFPEEKRLMREISFKSDFYALGHFILFLLYSGYEPVVQEEKSWDEELKISEGAKTVIKRMLQIEKQYEMVDELMEDCRKLF